MSRGHTYDCPRPLHCTEKEGPTELRNVVAMPVQCLLQSSSLLAFLMCGLRGMGSPRRFDQLVLIQRSQSVVRGFYESRDSGSGELRCPTDRLVKLGAYRKERGGAII
jgi:hypothetical protein